MIDKRLMEQKVFVYVRRMTIDRYYTHTNTKKERNVYIGSMYISCYELLINS